VSDETVGSYVLVEKLGEGGMGEVYLAEHKYIARRAAIKFLLRDLSGSADLVGRFFAEARAASVIKHPGIVEVLDCDVHDDGRAYIVMELLRGESLRDYIERVASVGRDEPGALAIFRQIASALAAAHAQEIIHRDLKPDNVFLHVAEDAHPPGQPIVKVLDFGIAKLMGRSGEGGTKTRTGQLLGTPMYMSPEQCRGAKQIDSRSDIYSLGCIMYEVFCGRAPFLDEGFGDLIIAHVSRPPPEPLEMAPWMTPVTRDVLLACLAKDPNDRPQTMNELVAHLAHIGAPEVIRLQTPVIVGGPRAVTAPSGGRALGTPRSPPPRLAQTTPMPGSDPRARGVHSPAPLPSSQETISAVNPAPISGAGGRTRLLQGEPNTLQEGASESLHRTQRGRSGSSKLLIGAISIGAVGLAAMVIIRALTTNPPAPSNDPPTEAEVTPPRPKEVEQRAAPTVTQPQPPPPPPATSLITLTGLPPEAIVRVDGRAATPPLTVPRQSEMHRLLIEARGYQRKEITFDGEIDHAIAVELQRIVARVSKPPGTKTHKRSDRPPHDSSPGFKAFTDL
jgi:serine/threonine-protein kinase